MQTIVAGTDFSKSSLNACLYAAMLAKVYKCKLVLFNLHEVSWVHANSGLFLLDMYKNRRKNEIRITKQMLDLKTAFPDLQISSFVQSGSFKKEIKTFSEHHQLKLIVMGLAEKNRFYKSIYGSHGVDIAGKLMAPVVIVPEQFKSHSLSHTLLAVDNSEKLQLSSLHEFEYLIKKTKAQVNVLHCRTKDEVFEPIKKTVKLNGTNAKIETLTTQNLKKGIREYSKEKNIDLVVLISRQHSLFYNLFAESNTKQIALDARVPVMAIHE